MPTQAVNARGGGTSSSGVGIVVCRPHHCLVLALVSSLVLALALGIGVGVVIWCWCWCCCPALVLALVLALALALVLASSAGVVIVCWHCCCHLVLVSLSAALVVWCCLHYHPTSRGSQAWCGGWV